MSRLLRLITLICILACACGCVPLNYAVFVNNSKSVLYIVQLDPGGMRILHSCTVPPGRTAKMEIRIAPLLIFDGSGSSFVRRELKLADPTHTYADPGERLDYFYLDGKNIYRIPKQFRLTWSSHVREIVQHPV